MFTLTAYSSFETDSSDRGIIRLSSALTWVLNLIFLDQIQTLSAGTRSQRGGASSAQSGAPLSAASDILHNMPQAWH